MPSYPNSPNRYPGTRNAYPVTPKAYPGSLNAFPPGGAGLNVVFHGNSITRGAVSSNDATLSWVGLTSSALSSQLPGITCSRKGFDGYTTPDLTSNFSAEVNALKIPGKRNIVVLSEVGNNVLINGASAAAAEANVTAYVTPAKAAGWEVLVGTCPPRAVPGHWSAGMQTIVNNVNIWIRANSMAADGFIEMADTGVLPFLPDGCHPNDTGHAFLAAQATPGLISYLTHN